MILDVLEDVHAHDRVDPFVQQIGFLSRPERKPERRQAEIRLRSEPAVQRVEIELIEIRSDDAFAVGEITRLIADTRSDFENALAEKRVEAVVQPLVVSLETGHAAQGLGAYLVNGPRGDVFSSAHRAGAFQREYFTIVQTA